MSRRLVTTAALIWLAAMAAVVPSTGSAQMPDGLPFHVGERLTYRVELSRLGKAGSAVMSMEGPVEIRGIATYALRFDFKARVGPIKAVERTESWVDLARMASLRFFKEEHHPFAHRGETIELFLDRGRWEAADGSSGEIAAAAPLDELSFMYFIRTLTLRPDSLYQFNRHFDARRNPTTLRMTRRDTITTGAGRYPVMLVEMRVRDSRRYNGEGLIRIYLTDDDLRLPVRIESAMPLAGMAVLTLESHTQPHVHRVAVERASIPFPPRE